MTLSGTLIVIPFGIVSLAMQVRKNSHFAEAWHLHLRARRRGSVNSLSIIAWIAGEVETTPEVDGMLSSSFNKILIFSLPNLNIY